MTYTIPYTEEIIKRLDKWLMTDSQFAIRKIRNGHFLKKVTLPSNTATDVLSRILNAIKTVKFRITLNVPKICIIHLRMSIRDILREKTENISSLELFFLSKITL